MKKLLFLLFAVSFSAILLPGCGSGPGVSTEEEAEQSMDESMTIDTAAEADAATE